MLRALQYFAQFATCAAPFVDLRSARPFRNGHVIRKLTYGAAQVANCAKFCNARNIYILFDVVSEPYSQNSSCNIHKLSSVIRFDSVIDFLHIPLATAQRFRSYLLSEFLPSLTTKRHGSKRTRSRKCNHFVTGINFNAKFAGLNAEYTVPFSESFS